MTTREREARMPPPPEFVRPAKTEEPAAKQPTTRIGRVWERTKAIARGKSQLASAKLIAADKTDWKSGFLPDAEIKKRYPNFDSSPAFVATNKIEMRESSHGYGTAAFATKPFKKGELILQLAGTFKEKASEHSLRVSAQLHQETKDESAAENYLNHSFEPTGKWDYSQATQKGTLKIGLYATRDIKPGEELTYDYRTSDLGRGPGEKKGEDDFVDAITGKPVTGFGQLMLHDIKAARELAPQCTPYLQGVFKAYEGALAKGLAPEAAFAQALAVAEK